MRSVVLRAVVVGFVLSLAGCADSSSAGGSKAPPTTPTEVPKDVKKKGGAAMG